MPRRTTSQIAASPRKVTRRRIGTMDPHKNLRSRQIHPPPFEVRTKAGELGAVGHFSGNALRLLHAPPCP